MLAGYRVINLAVVKVRDLGWVGEAIGAAAEAGGDAVRINSIRFTVEDTGPYMAQLRELAVTDALVKAEHFAALAGVPLGRLVGLYEAGGLASVPKTSPTDVSRTRWRRPLTPRCHPLTGGELELRTSIQAVFEIN